MHDSAGCIEPGLGLHMAPGPAFAQAWLVVIQVNSQTYLGIPSVFWVIPSYLTLLWNSVHDMGLNLVNYRLEMEGGQTHDNISI